MDMGILGIVRKETSNCGMWSWSDCEIVKVFGIITNEILTDEIEPL